MFVTNWNSTTKIQKISEITNFFRHYFLSRTEVLTNQLFIKSQRLQLACRFDCAGLKIRLRWLEDSLALA